MNGWLVKAERDPDSGGWVPVDYEDLDAESGTVWGPRP